jgi:hypothetical protein
MYLTATELIVHLSMHIRHIPQGSSALLNLTEVTHTFTCTLSFIACRPPLPPLSFAAPFGDNMVLQMAPAKAAVYGFLGAGGTGVTVTVTRDGKVVATVKAALNTTAQPFGDDYGVRPNNTCVGRAASFFTLYPYRHPTPANGTQPLKLAWPHPPLRNPPSYRST